MSTTEVALMRPNCFAVVQKIGGSYPRVTQLKCKKPLLIEKLKFLPDNAFGQPFGTVFEVKKGLHLEVSSVPSNTNLADVSHDDDNMPSCSQQQQQQKCTTANGTAEDISEDDRGTIEKKPRLEQPLPQALKEDDVLEMKRVGTKGHEIVSRLVAGNTAFGDRTEYSQEKYVRRKTKKHGDRIVLLQPTVRLVAESYYHKEPDRVANLRMDLVSELVTRANVHSGSRVLLVEQAQGLVTAAVLHRLSGNGMCIHVHQHEQAQAIPGVHAMNYDEKHMSTFYPMPTSFLQRKSNEELKTEVDSSKPLEIMRIIEHTELDESQLPATQKLRLSDEVLAERRRKRAMKRDKYKLVEQIINNRRVDCLIVVSRNLALVPMVKHLLPAVKPSGVLVAYCTNLQPVIELYDELRVSDRVCDIRLSDTFFRQHQVLPGRSHPEMVQLVAGGFILSATTLL